MDLIEGCKIAAVFATGYMAGTGIYISLVEVQSRRSLPPKALWMQFTKSFKMAAKSMVYRQCFYRSKIQFSLCIYKSLELYDLEDEEFKLLVYFRSYQILFFLKFLYVLHNTVTFLMHVITVLLIYMIHVNRFQHCFLLQILSTLVTASAPTYLYFVLEGSRSRNLWLVSPATFLVGSIYTFTVIIPEVNVMLDENVIEKKGRHFGHYCLNRSLSNLGQKSACIIK